MSGTVVTLFLGAMLGGGLILLAASLRTRPVPLVDVLDVLNGPAGLAASDQTNRAGISIRQQLGEIAAKVTGQSDVMRRDLSVLGRTHEEHALAKVTAPALAILSCYMVWAATLMVGAAIPPIWATLAALCFAGVAFMTPDLLLRRRAHERRVEFRHALSAYLDLVTIILAGGGGITTALQTAADAGGGWAFEEFRHALDYARLSNRAPWAQFADLADKFDIPELTDLTSAADLAGDEGSKIADSIAIKAAVLRSRLGAEVESEAESLTERMVVPVFGLLIAMFLFIGFGVASELLTPTSTIDSPNQFESSNQPNGS